jgi:HAE1 family hydrophobic/amphiphilic exporter-1
MAARINTRREVADASPVPADARGLRRGLGRARLAALETAPMWALRVLLFWPLGLLAKLIGAVMRPVAGAWQRAYSAVETRYRDLLVWALGHRAAVLGVAVLLLALTGLMLTRIGVELITLSASLRGHDALTANYSVAGTGNRLDANAESGGENKGTVTLVMKPEAFSREAELTELLRSRIVGIPGVSYRFTRPTLFTLKTPLEVEVSGYDLEAIAKTSEGIRNAMHDSSRFTEVETTLLPGHPEIQVLFDQERAAALGLEIADLANRVAHSVQGQVATRYQLGDREIDVLVRGAEGQRASVDAIANLIVNPEAARPVRLSSVADVRVRSGPSEIRRLDQQRVIVVSASIAYGDLGEAMQELQGIIARTPMPSGIVADVAGQSEEMKVSFRSLQLALALAIFLVYLVMASQFESLVQPLVILFSIPLAAVGAIGALFVTGTELNVIALIGMVMLIGIVVKNGIILIDLVNRLRHEGLSRREALLQAGPTRLRPILMTTLTAVLGLVPMAIGGGLGAEMRQPMAITVIGGLTISTLLTLVVIPVVYTLLDRQPDRQPEPRPAQSPGHASGAAGGQPAEQR